MKSNKPKIITGSLFNNPEINKIFIENNFAKLFLINMPIANHPEIKLYIEKGLEFLGTSNKNIISIYPFGLLEWMNTNKNDLIVNDTYSELKKRITITFLKLLENFEIYELSEIECKKLGRSFESSEYPYNAQTIEKFLDEIIIFEEFKVELDEIINKLIKSENINNICWYIHIAAYSKNWLFEMNAPFPELAKIELKEELFHKLHRFSVFYNKYVIANSIALKENRYKYKSLIRF